MKFNIGDTVRLISNLQVGATYYNEKSPKGDKFTSQMRNNLAGKDAVITQIVNNGYILEGDNTFTYYDGMLELSRDNFAEKEYEFNADVERLIGHMQKQHVMAYIDKALDDNMHITNPEEFQKLADLYKQIS